MAYLIGSVPFALLVAKRWGAADLRRVGSGNLGAANVVRASGMTAGVLVALLDMSKGAAGVIVASRLDSSAAAPAVAGLAAILGHIYPVWLRFRGGKGVATACGVFTILTPAAISPAVAGVGATLWWTRDISARSLLGTIRPPPGALATGRPAPAG